MARTSEQLTNSEILTVQSLDNLADSGVNQFLAKSGGVVINKTEIGGGTVTDVSVVTANGVSGSVATSTTTPAITLTLGDITPSSVVSTGAVESKTSLILEDPGAGVNTITMQAPTLAGNYTLTLPVDDGTPNQVLTTDGSGVLSWTTNGVGTVTDVSVVHANGFNGSVANSTTTPAITLTTDVTGIIKGNGTALSAASAGTDYVAPSTTVNGHALSSNVSLNLASADFANEGTTTQVLHGNAAGNPAFGAVVEADITLANNGTNNATTLRHGFLPILSGNPSQFLDGNGNYSLPSASIANSYSLTTFSAQTSVNVVHNFGTYPVVQVIDGSGNVLVPLTTTNNTLNDFTVTFSVSTSGSIIATVGSPQPQAYKTVSGNYTILDTDQIIEVTATATITLPTAVGDTGREFTIDNAALVNITVNTTSSQTINGNLTQTLPPNSAMTVYSNGANWRII